MALDPRMFLGIGGPVAPQAMLPPGFRPPGPAPGAQLLQQPQQQMGMPGMGGMGMMRGMLAGGPNPSTTGATMGNAENNGLGAAVSGIGALTPNPDGTWPQPQMPTNIGAGGGGGMGGPGSFMSWLKGLF